MISLWSSRKYVDEECTDSRPSEGRGRERGGGESGRGKRSNIYLRGCAGDFEQIYDNGMHLGRPISLLPAGLQSWALVRTCTLVRVRISNRIQIWSV